MLVITELAEAVEGIRRNLNDDKLVHRSMEEVEMADAFIRLCDIAAGFGHTIIPLVPDSRMMQHEDRCECMMEIVEAVVTAWNVPNGDMSLSVCLWAIRSYCLKFNLDLEGAMIEKRKFNQTREDHSIEQRKTKHGKSF